MIGRHHLKMSQRITTELLGDHPLLSSISTSAELSTAWIRSGDGLVGFGEYKKLEVVGADRFKKAREWWSTEIANFSIHNNVHGSGTGPILFTSFAFDENQPSVLIIPQIVIGQKNGKSWITWIGEQSQPDISQLKNEQDTMAKINETYKRIKI
jgi:menaquinone-specific isochorismate synthase